MKKAFVLILFLVSLGYSQQPMPRGAKIDSIWSFTANKYIYVKDTLILKKAIQGSAMTQGVTTIAGSATAPLVLSSTTGNMTLTKTGIDTLSIGAVGTMAGRDSTNWKTSASGTFTRDSLVTRGGISSGGPISGTDFKIGSNSINTAGTLTNVFYNNQANVVHGGLQQMDSLSLSGNLRSIGETIVIGPNSVISAATPSSVLSRGASMGIFASNGSYISAPANSYFESFIGGGYKDTATTTAGPANGTNSIIGSSLSKISITGTSATSNAIHNSSQSYITGNGRNQAIYNGYQDTISSAYSDVTINGGYNNRVYSSAHQIWLMGYNLANIYPGAYNNLTFGAALTNNAFKSSMLFGSSNVQDTVAFPAQFVVRNIPFVLSSDFDTASGSSTQVTLEKGGSADSSFYQFQIRRDNYYLQGSTIFELFYRTQFDPRSNIEMQPYKPTNDNLSIMRFFGSDKSLHFFNSKSVSSPFGNFYVDSGKVVIWNAATDAALNAPSLHITGSATIDGGLTLNGAFNAGTNSITAGGATFSTSGSTAVHFISTGGSGNDWKWESRTDGNFYVGVHGILDAFYIKRTDGSTNFSYPIYGTSINASGNAVIDGGVKIGGSTKALIDSAVWNATNDSLIVYSNGKRGAIKMNGFSGLILILLVGASVYLFRKRFV